MTNTGAAVVLEANNDLTIAEAIVTDNPNGDGGDITLRAGRSVLINAAIVTDNGDFTAIANETTANGVVSSQRLPGRAEIRFNGREARVDAGSGTATFTNSELLGEIRTDWAFTIGASLPHIHVTASSATFSAYSVPNMRTRVDTLTLAGVSGSTVFNEGNLVLKLLTTSGSFMDMRTTGMLQLGAPVSMQANGIFLIGNGVTIDQNITTGGLLYLDGGAGGLNIKGVSAIARSVQLLGASINIGDVNGSTPTLVAGNFIGAAPLGHLTLQGGAASGASATLSSPGGIHLTPGGDLRVRGGSAPDAKAVVFGGDGAHMTVGGLVKIDAGAGSGAYARIEAALPGSMLLEFPTTAPAGYSINGIEGVVTSGASGFFATGRPAVPPQDLLITYGSATPFRFRGGVSLSPFLPSIEEVTSRMPLRNVMTRAPDALTRASDALTTELERVRLVLEFLFPDPGERSRDREGR